ncbi:MAG: hypothetical protein E7363_00315 [Clostridiales bacterium]|nr:hypothetical protein [Clostridiales bacterium]
MDKAITFLGFAQRKRAVVKGVNAVSYQKKASLLILCSTAKENTVKAAKSLSKKLHAPLLVSNEPVENLVHKENCKLIAVTDMNLARAILENVGETFSILEESEN